MSNPTQDAAPARDSQTTVLLVDDHAIWRGGVKSMLEDTAFRVVGEAASGSEAVEQTRALRPQLVLLDIRMAGGDGLDVLETLKAEHPLLIVVMLTTYDNPTFMARAVAGGAAGYLLKGIDFQELLEALYAVMNGDTLLSAEHLQRSLRGLSAETNGLPELEKPLSEREVEVLRLMATGLSNRDIAPLLFIGESTVKTHVANVISKLGVSDRVQAAVWAARNGLMEDA